MKPINIDKETEIELFKLVVEKFKKELESFKSNMNDSKFTLSMDFSQPAKEKVTVLYTPQAYLKMQALVDFYDTEVGWYGLVQRMTDKVFRVYDIKVCKQYVNGAKVDTEDEDTLEFFNSLTDEEAEDMRFQAHSHVKMSTEASSVDLQNQADVVRNLGRTGFYIFQIWNKNGDINTYLYDLDSNIFYDKKDVQLEVEDDQSTISDFVDSTLDLVIEKKPYQCQQINEYSKAGKKSKKEKENYGNSYLNGYWDGTSYYGGYDW